MNGCVGYCPAHPKMTIATSAGFYFVQYTLMCSRSLRVHHQYVCYTKKVSRFYFYTVVVGFAGGVAAASLFEIDFVYTVWLVLIAGVAGLIAQKSSESSSSDTLVLVALFLLTSSLGIIRFELAAFGEAHETYEALIDSEVVLQGVVAREPDVREKVTHLYVQVDDELLLVKTDRYAAVSYGDLIRIEGELSKPESFATDLGRTFKYPEYLHARGVSYTVSFADVSVLLPGQGNMFISKILETKQWFMHSIEAVIPEPQVGLAEGLLLGVKQALGDELEAVFRKTGIIHIVVLSGYNVMLVVIFITYVLSYVLPYRTRVPFGILAIVCFAVLVGLSATVVRASIMASLILFARATGRTYAVMRALCFAGVVMILINPYLLVYDVGFQLSFLATLGLIFLAPYIESRLHQVPNWLQAREFLTATVATQIFVMPILLYSIGEFSVVSVVVNVLVLPMVPIAMLLTFITGMTGLVSLNLALLFGFVTTMSLSYILIVAEFFAQIPFASFTVEAFPFWIVVVSYGVMGYGLYWLQHIQAPAETILAGWIIEDESILTARLKENSVTRADGVTEEIPRFFR
jgi:competence protein ComEC